jgi:hypothetical protein
MPTSTRRSSSVAAVQLAFVQDGQRAPALEGAQVPSQIVGGAGAGRIHVEHRVERVGGLLMIEELLVVDGSDALEQTDLLTRRDGEIELSAQHLDQVLVAPATGQHAIEPAQRVEVLRVLLEHRPIEALGVGELVELDLVGFGDLAERGLALFAASASARPSITFSARAVSPCALSKAHEALAPGTVARIFAEHALVEIERRPAGYPADWRAARGLGAQVARHVRRRDVRAA